MVFRFNSVTKMRSIELRNIKQQFSFFVEGKAWFARYGVYFYERDNNNLFRDPPEGEEIRSWIRENVTGRTMVGSSYIFFEYHEDALLCHLKFCGGQNVLP